MADPDRRNILVFNGMIYNFRELRRELEAAGERFESETDTEVLLRAYGVWDTNCVSHLEGMFAFAVADQRKQCLFLARDRLGIKPLYYWRRGAEMAFASQVRALLASGLVPKRLSTEGIGSFLSTGAVEEPLTAIEGVAALPAGHTALFDGSRLSVRSFWTPPTVADAKMDKREAQSQLIERLEASVASHLVSDRPTGVFLSGGLDSSALAALAARRVPGVKTVSVGFRETQFSEAHHAATLARAIGSDHTEVELTPADFAQLLADAFLAMDQPSFDGINTFVVSRAAASLGLTVALSGLGSDELFDGYGLLARSIALEQIQRIPTPMHRAVARVAPAVLRGPSGTKLGEWFREGAVASPYELMRRLFPAADVQHLLPAWRPVAPNGSAPQFSDRFNQLAADELSGYMRNVLLRDTDAMAMSNSLEVRVPFLHDPFVEWSLRLPGKLKGHSKALLRDSMKSLLPSEAWDRPKRGFVLPIPIWLSGQFADDASGLLSDGAEAVAPLFDPAAVRHVWAEFQTGRGGWLRPWALYSLIRWYHTLPTPA